jgi:nucleotide-binding universal stress UspA family protein
MSLAELYGARIVFLHVLPEVPDYMDSHIIGYISESQWEAIKGRHFSEAKAALIGKKRDSTVAREVLDQFCADAEGLKENLAALADEIHVKEGNPVEMILEQADESDCDLIVMGTHGTGSLVDAMIGSTARRVVRRSQKPVLVVRLPE